MTSNKEFKEVKEIKKKTNDCTLSRTDMYADAVVRLMQKAVGVTRERRYVPDCSAVIGNLPKLPEFLKLLTDRLVPAAELHGFAV